MVLAGCLGAKPWEVLGTDISNRVLETARNGIYPMEAAKHIPENMLRTYCLKGKGCQEGTFAMGRELRSRVTFDRLNLTRPLPNLGQFDAVFLRNVMIYFARPVKHSVVERVASTIRPGGCLLIGHAESLAELSRTFDQVAPSVFRVRAT